MRFLEILIVSALQGEAQQDFKDSFQVDKADLASTGRNPYFILEPGYTLILEGGKVRLQIQVLDQTEKVDGVETRVVEEKEWEEGELIEISRNFFAISKTTRDVYYFGEDVDIYKDGKVVAHSGAWRSGVDGARFGLMMPGEPKVGMKYYQEIAPGVAMDRAEIQSVTDTFETPAGKYEKVVTTRETTPLERDVSRKHYAPGVGLLSDGEAKLVKIVK